MRSRHISIRVAQSTGQRTREMAGNGGAALQAARVHHGMEDHLLKGNSSIKVRSAVPTPIMASVLAAFLAHDFPLVDAVMLARAYRGAGWPTSLADYPLPLGSRPLRFHSPNFRALRVSMLSYLQAIGCIGCPG